MGQEEELGGDGWVVDDKLQLPGHCRCRDASHWPLQRIGMGRQEGARINQKLRHQIYIFTKGMDFLKGEKQC